MAASGIPELTYDGLLLIVIVIFETSENHTSGKKWRNVKVATVFPWNHGTFLLGLYRMNAPVLPVISHSCWKRADSTRNENRIRRVITYTPIYSRSMNRMPVVSSLIPSVYSFL